MNLWNTTCDTRNCEIHIILSRTLAQYNYYKLNCTTFKRHSNCIKTIVPRRGPTKKIWIIHSINNSYPCKKMHFKEFDFHYFIFYRRKMLLNLNQNLFCKKKQAGRLQSSELEYPKLATLIKPTFFKLIYFKFFINGARALGIRYNPKLIDYVIL